MDSVELDCSSDIWIAENFAGTSCRTIGTGGIAFWNRWERLDFEKGIKTMYTLENVARIWNDNTGEYIEVGPDNDALDLLDLLEIQAYTNDKSLAGL